MPDGHDGDLLSGGRDSEHPVARCATVHGGEDAARLRSLTTSGLLARLAAAASRSREEAVAGALGTRQDPDAEERGKALLVEMVAEAYGWDEGASALLRQRLKSPERARTASRHHSARELLLLVEHSGVSVPVRLLAAARLGPLADAGLRHRLYSVCRLAGGDVRLAAAVALASAGDPRVVSALIEGLEHEHADARFAAMTVLGMLGAAASPALSPLEELAGSDPERYVRRSARRAVALITRGVRLGPTELEAAEVPAGRGTELEAGPAGRGTEPEAASAPTSSGDEPVVGDPPSVGATADARTLSP